MSENKLLRPLFLGNNTYFGLKLTSAQPGQAITAYSPVQTTTPRWHTGLPFDGIDSSSKQHACLSRCTAKKFYVFFDAEPPLLPYQTTSRRCNSNELYYSNHCCRSFHVYFPTLFLVPDTQLDSRIDLIDSARRALKGRFCSRSQSASSGMGLIQPIALRREGHWRCELRTA